ncbi:MAG: SDR family oxidoreductase [Acidobacteriia bacterium]|nr:SDR family oxidoreductase [Terriglobia bacterium]
MIRIDNKVALITGAAAGIGAAIAEHFSEAGAAVVVFDINGEGARRMEEKLRQSGRALAVIGDVSCEEDVKAAIEQTIREFRTLDILINNAGIEVAGPMIEMTSSDWDHQLNVNLKSVFLLAKYAIPHLRGHGGAIVNISSVHAFVSYEGNAAYDASKAGMLGLTRALALEHGRDGIRVNAICPGYIDTPMMDEWLRTQPDAAATLRQVLGVHPLGRIGTPRDVADAALFLASDAASFISGTFLVVDGAMTVAGH